jgi:hypothetical protein
VTAPTERRIDALDVPTAVLEASLRAGRLSEYAHLLHDADPDSTWGEQPERRRPTGYAPDCDPEFADRPVANVETGGAL